ncbi:germination lipoprotein GerS-related protein [Clostridium sp. BJN0001]|uniref:germination lipoprotein GerS-related protein n=1 Tax=Clostridium sp. BJN0001 TaxID=2930219 RepID=UPI001FD4FDB9|nr:germination lipoprotein GerS-related protein [Clostridium sp. BJN0001]
MKINKESIKRNVPKIVLLMIPIIIISCIIISRKMVTPSDSEIVNNLKNVENYSCSAEYTFKNSRSEYKEMTKQFYSRKYGSRIEFDDLYKRVKVYNGTEIKIKDINDENFKIDSDIDCVYPLAFMNNFFMDDKEVELNEIQPEWADKMYIEAKINYNSKNSYFYVAKLYIDKNTKSPEMLIITDENKNERIIIRYTNFKIEKELDSDLF